MLVILNKSSVLLLSSYKNKDEPQYSFDPTKQKTHHAVCDVMSSAASAHHGRRYSSGFPPFAMWSHSNGASLYRSIGLPTHSRSSQPLNCEDQSLFSSLEKTRRSLYPPDSGEYITATDLMPARSIFCINSIFTLIFF